jgi:hypothetical protein
MVLDAAQRGGSRVNQDHVESGDLLFKVSEPSGRIYRVFTDGRILGFDEGAIVENRFHPLLASGGSISHASACPTSNATDSRVGAGQSFGDHFEGREAKIRPTLGEK